jgi:hypothetical protein
MSVYTCCKNAEPAIIFFPNKKSLLSDSHGKPGSKDICQKFDGIQIMCEQGICWNVSAAYMCEFKDVLQVKQTKKEMECNNVFTLSYSCLKFL